MIARSAGARAAASRRRKEAKKRQLKARDNCKHLLDQYDTDASGTLDREQLKKLMTDMNKGEPPDDNDVEDVFVRADKSKTGALLKSEVMLAASVWSSWLKDKPWIDKVFETYDTNSSGVLEHDQLQRLLTDLNEGKAPTDEEVADIISKVDRHENGSVNKDEVKGAVRMWWTNETESQTPKSRACTIS